MSITAFGKKVSRDKAIDIIIKDKICDICYAQNTDSLEDLLLWGWKSLEEWTNSEIEECIEGLSIENQPGGKI